MAMARPGHPPPRGDRRAEFEELALPALRALLRTARRLARPPHEATDLVQETFLRAYRTFDNFEPGTNPRAWLFRILYSVAANFADKQRRHPEVSADDIDTRFAMRAGAQRDEELALLVQFDGSPHIDAALDRLPEEFRSAVLLVDLEDFSYEEAAEVLGCPIGTLRSRLFRGRKHLFLALESYARELGFLKER